MIGNKEEMARDIGRPCRKEKLDRRRFNPRSCNTRRRAKAKKENVAFCRVRSKPVKEYALRLPGELPWLALSVVVGVECSQCRSRLARSLAHSDCCRLSRSRSSRRFFGFFVPCPFFRLYKSKPSSRLVSSVNLTARHHPTNDRRRAPRTRYPTFIAKDTA
ncbi:uncharacterized protein IWZ02DRAFT_450015 [Phyllosticta citriasiana]|uniref:uncharacterized protein n=1 Tax=Phyllosticta citriasiana TaxID=595635 RepID=UPI0030FDB625